jgi:hypothetical protein
MNEKEQFVFETREENKSMIREFEDSYIRMKRKARGGLYMNPQTKAMNNTMKDGESSLPILYDPDADDDGEEKK